MKSYEEMTESVFKRSDAIIKKKKERRKAMKLITTMLSCLLIIAGTAFGILNRDRSGMTSADITQEQQPNNMSSSQTSSEKTFIPADDPDIVWAITNPNDTGLVDWKNKQIGSELYEVLSSNARDTVFAITIQAVKSRYSEYRRYSYNGKTLAEYEKEAEEESKLPDKLVRLLKDGDDLKHGAALYISGNENGVKWSKESYDSEVAYLGKELLSKYIVGGEFLREKLEYDCTQPVTIAARIAWHKAYEEYENHIIRQTEELLTKQGIAFERKSAIMYDKVLKCPFTDPAAEDAYMEIEISKPYLIIYISNENFASLDINYEFCVFNLADKSARDGVLPSGSYDFDLPKDAALPADS